MAVLIPGVGIVDTTNSVLLPGGVYQKEAAATGVTGTLAATDSGLDTAA